MVAPFTALTAGHPTEPNCSSRGGPFRSGSARLGRSQKDGLPLPPWGSTLVRGSRPSTRAPPVFFPSAKCRRSGARDRADKSIILKMRTYLDRVLDGRLD